MMCVVFAMYVVCDFFKWVLGAFRKGRAPAAVLLVGRRPLSMTPVLSGPNRVNDDIQHVQACLKESKLVNNIRDDVPRALRRASGAFIYVASTDGGELEAVLEQLSATVSRGATAVVVADGDGDSVSVPVCASGLNVALITNQGPVGALTAAMVTVLRQGPPEARADLLQFFDAIRAITRSVSLRSNFVVRPGTTIPGITVDARR